MFAFARRSLPFLLAGTLAVSCGYQGLSPTAPTTTTVAGRLVDPHTHAPLSGALVTLKDVNPPLEIRTDARGRFQFTDVPLDKRAVTVSLGSGASAMALGEGAFMIEADGATATTAADATGLTPEESALLDAGLLPNNYAQLKAAMQTGGVAAAEAIARAGKSGPFAVDVGDPTAMLTTARYAKIHPEFARMLRSVKRGDVIVASPNDRKAFISDVTGGPYTHTFIIVDPQPPAMFIEAIGASGVPGDPTGNMIRWSDFNRYADNTSSYRLVRPYETVAASAQAGVINQAISFAQAQLGKPYNYSFSDSEAAGRGYYCSSLVYWSYKNAGVNWNLKKDAARDRLLEAFRNVGLSLEPDDTFAVSTSTMEFMMGVNKPTPQQLGDFVVNQLLPHCKRTQNIALTPDQKARLASVIAQVLSGDAFPRYTQAAQAYQQAAAEGKFDQPITGGLLRAQMAAAMADALVQDSSALVKTADINTWPALQAFRAILGAILPYADDFTAYMTGPTSQATKSVSGFLDVLDAIHKIGVPEPAHSTPNTLKLSDMPGRGPWQEDDDFIAPNDIAWAGLPSHQDFDARSGWPLDPPWPFAIVPESGHF